jgi:Mg-chelatase subunit ChlD
LVLDESGSMGHLRQSTIDGANAWLADQRRDGPNDHLDLIMFDSREGEWVRVKRSGKLCEVDDLTLADYNPNGGTPLYDAVGFTLNRIELAAEGRKVVVVVMTDGFENASREFTREAVAAKIAEKEAAGWTIMYLGANQDAKAVAQAVGMSPMYASNYVASNLGNSAMYTATSNATRAVRYRASAHAVSSLVAASATGSPVASLSPEDAQLLAGSGTVKPR